jgi:hypothetical protein
MEDPACHIGTLISAEGQSQHTRLYCGGVIWLAKTHALVEY